MVSLVDDLKTLWSSVAVSMQKNGVLVGMHEDREACKSDSNRCEKVKDFVQELMNQGFLQFSRDRTLGEVYVIKPIEIVYRNKKIEAPMKKVQPIVIHVPSHFPYHNSKVVPWKYDATVSVGSEEVQFPNAEIVDISGLGRMTRSGRVFAPKYTPKVVRTPMTIPTPPPQEGTSVCVSTTPVMAHVSSMSKGTSSNLA